MDGRLLYKHSLAVRKPKNVKKKKKKKNVM